MSNAKYRQILLFEERSIDTEKHKEILEEMGIYLLPYRKAEMDNSPELLNVCAETTDISAIGFEIESDNEYEQE